MAITAAEMPSTNRSMTCRAAGSPDAASCRTASGVGFTNPSSRAEAVRARADTTSSSTRALPSTPVAVSR